MKITLTCFGFWAEDKDKGQLDLKEGTDFKGLFLSLASQKREAVEWWLDGNARPRKGLIILYNGTPWEWLEEGEATVLKDGDEITILPPLDGG